MSLFQNGKKLGVIGGGAMGSGIAAHAAIVGKLPINLYLKSEAHVKKSTSVINMWIRYFLSKSGPEAQQFAKSLISYKLSYDSIPECDYIIETITEDLKLKKMTFDSMNSLLSPSQIVATNTSSISITQLGSLVRYPERFIGLHFFNPTPMMKLVEVVPGLQTNESTIEQSKELVKILDKRMILSKDIPAFVVNRILTIGLIESYGSISEGITKSNDVDVATKIILDSKFGLMKTLDMIGVHVAGKIAEYCIDSFGDDKFRVSSSLRESFDSIKKK